MKFLRITAAMCCIALATGCSPAPRSTDQTHVHIFGAASSRVINDDLAALIKDENLNVMLDFVNAGSSTLVQQLHDQAPGDVFISADQRSMDAAVAQGSVSDPIAIARNHMVMVVPKQNRAGITSIHNIDDAKVVLCDKQVPCGKISQELLRANHLSLSPVSLENSVSDVLGKVVSGEADAGWVYRTDAIAAKDSVTIVDIPESDSYANTLYAAVVTHSEHPDEARRITELLASKNMAPIWRDHGFIALQ
ncbi:molybdate ABC transporter substrate-binding protein [Corynebacterium diphtheriae]|uniref:Molybdenum ABC transporter substrate-binding protein n=1 Tax=Corynebacterium diphtheriae bv. gravis TaxID=1720349 RepID=A0AAX0J3B6_CORDP|nr:molybdate ABC transporter substrate-binding protein [Corynebacterium diphtheriae]ERA58614.1 putative molybdate transport system solute-binding protein [Corynebacterium diphtheriae DSM 43988]AEX66650.1 putative molybdate transport system solute-binding protein [Corynebacterium diphtheriae C7 (beta)]MBN4651890.1 molybdate ABC transporter substrate-binding protein [Corynebacterium diphtheriae bv. mitis]MBN4652820.1 molybdate ABC transporter substrate-binding protein [Corynebacterium diphtheriae